MNAGTFFVRAWRFLSIFGFLIALFSSHISYPDEVAVRFNDQGQPIQTIDRETIFYLAIAIFIISNTFLNVLKRLFIRVPIAQLPVPNQALWATHRPKLNQIFTEWFSLLTSAINTILALGLLVLSLLNRGDRSMPLSDYVWLLPVSTVILIAVIVTLPIRLFKKPSDEQ